MRFASHLHRCADWYAAEVADGFDPGSARLACVYDGRFWRNAKLWMRHVCDYSDAVQAQPFEKLSMAHMQLLLGGDDEWGWSMLRRVGWTGRHLEPLCPRLALARTILYWSESIEEWP